MASPSKKSVRGGGAELDPGCVDPWPARSPQQSSGSGGGISNAIIGTLTLANSTVSGNSAAYGGGIDNATNAPATVMLKNTIIANSRAGVNCYPLVLEFPFLSFAHNLSDDGTCSSSLTATGDLNNTAARLDAGGLENNGGPTRTIALLRFSPAVDAIPLGYCTTIDAFLVATDQRVTWNTRPDWPSQIRVFPLRSRRAELM